MIINDIHRGIEKRKNRKRVGRGPGSGHGKTGGRGDKGHSARAGFSRLDKDSLVQAAALDLDADYIRGLASVGYPNLTLNQYSSLKAVDVTPEYIRDLRRSGYGPFSVDRLVQMKAIGIDLDDLRAPPAPPRPPRPRNRADADEN